MSQHDAENLVTVFKVADPASLSLAQSILDEAGIAYFISNDGLQDLFGAGRIGVGYNPLVGPVEVKVRQADWAEATRLLAEVTVTAELSADPEEFALAAEQATDGGAGEQEDVAQTEAVPRTEQPQGLLSILILGIIIGAALTAMGFFFYHHSQKYFSGTLESDLNGDKKPDTFLTYENGEQVSLAEDRNFDGREDSWAYYQHGMLTSSKHDTDFNEITNILCSYKFNVLAEAQYFLDFDMNPDLIEQYEFGEIKERHWFRKSTEPYKKELFENNIIKEAYLDQNNDGRFDLKIVYDEYADPKETIRLQ